MIALVAVLIAWAGAHALIWHYARERTKGDQSEHERWMARQAEAEATLIRERVRCMESNRELMEAQVMTAHRIHDAFHPGDDEPWKRA